MAVIQDAFDIPDEMLAKIAIGELKRFGGVVRDNKGQIVKHLKRVDVPKAEEPTLKVGGKILQFAKNNKTGIIIGTFIIVAATAGTTYMVAKNRLKKNSAMESEKVLRFRMSLQLYLEAIKTGSLELSLIEDLLESLDDLKKQENYETIRIELSTKDLDLLVNRLYEYTQKLASDNKIKLSRLEKRPVNKNSTITSLEQYLKTQKRIFEEGA